MKKKFMENKKFRLIAVFLITVFIVGGFSFAWFYLRQAQMINSAVGNFKATPVCSFEGTTESFEDADGLITLSTDPYAENYIGNFRVKVTYTGGGWSYLRVRIVHEFSNGTESVQHPADLPYATDANKWHDSRSNDYCYYYMEQLHGDGEINLITGLADGGNEMVDGFADANAIIKVAVEADMVQINRYPQVWGIDKLPWK